MITASGIGSGLDVQSIVSQLMAMERKPLESLQSKQDILEAELSAYGQLKSALSKFQDAMGKLGDPSAFRKFQTSSSDEAVLTASASSTASIGTFDVEVVRRASHHKLGSNEHLSTDVFGGNAGDSLTVQIGSNPADSLVIDLSTAKTLAEIRTAINNDANNPGVTATIINGDGDNRKLVLTADDSGQANALALSYGGSLSAASFGFATLNDIGGDLSLLDAQLSVDGYTVNRASNSISDVISGVTLSLHDAAPGSTVTIQVERDNDAIKSAVGQFVDAYNSVKAEIRKHKHGMLEADGTLLNMERGMMAVFNTPASGSLYSTLSEVGVSFQKDGSLSLKESDLTSALQNNLGAVADLFAQPGQGFAVRLESLSKGWLANGGLIDARTDGLDNRIDRLSDNRDRLERRLVTVEARYVQQFAALDSLMGQMQSTSSFLTQQLANLNASG